MASSQSKRSTLNIPSATPQDIEDTLRKLIARDVYTNRVFLSIFVASFFRQVELLVKENGSGHPNDRTSLRYFLDRGRSNVCEWKNLKLRDFQVQDASSVHADDVAFCTSTSQECARAWLQVHLDKFNGRRKQQDSQQTGTQQRTTNADPLPKNDKKRKAEAQDLDGPLTESMLSRAANIRAQKHTVLNHRNRAFKSRSYGPRKEEIYLVASTLQQKRKRDLEIDLECADFIRDRKQREAYEDWCHVRYSKLAQAKFSPELFQHGPEDRTKDQDSPHRSSALFSSAPSSLAGSPTPSIVFSSPRSALPTPRSSPPVSPVRLDHGNASDPETSHVPVTACERSLAMHSQPELAYNLMTELVSPGVGATMNPRMSKSIKNAYREAEVREAIFFGKVVAGKRTPRRYNQLRKQEYRAGRRVHPDIVTSVNNKRRADTNILRTKLKFRQQFDKKLSMEEKHSFNALAHLLGVRGETPGAKHSAKIVDNAERRRICASICEINRWEASSEDMKYRMPVPRKIQELQNAYPHDVSVYRVMGKGKGRAKFDEAFSEEEAIPISDEVLAGMEENDLEEAIRRSKAESLSQQNHPIDYGFGPEHVERPFERYTTTYRQPCDCWLETKHDPCDGPSCTKQQYDKAVPSEPAKSQRPKRAVVAEAGVLLPRDRTNGGTKKIPSMGHFRGDRKLANGLWQAELDEPLPTPRTRSTGPFETVKARNAPKLGRSSWRHNSRTSPY